MQRVLTALDKVVCEREYHEPFPPARASKTQTPSLTSIEWMWSADAGATVPTAAATVTPAAMITFFISSSVFVDGP